MGKWLAWHDLSCWQGRKTNKETNKETNKQQLLRTKFKDITQKIRIHELRFLRSACPPMLVNISMKFDEDILNGFKVIEWFCHRNCYLQTSKGITQKIYIQDSWFLRSAYQPMLVNIYMKFHEDILNGFQVTGAVTILWQTHGQTDDPCKNYMSLNPKGDIIRNQKTTIKNAKPKNYHMHKIWKSTF